MQRSVLLLIDRMVHCIKSVLISQASLLVFYTMMKIGFEISTTLSSSDITGYLTVNQPNNITSFNRMSQSQVLHVIMYSKNYDTIEKKANDITG